MVREERAIDYADFEIEFLSTADRGLAVRVKDSPAGPVRDAFIAPPARDDLSLLLQGLGWRGERNYELHESDVRPQDPKAIGARLFQALFPPRVRQRFDESVGLVRGDGGLGLRLKIRFDPRDPTVNWLARVPWELLFRRDTGDYLCLDRRLSIVRFLEVERPRPRERFRAPLRAGVVLSSPSGYPALDVAEERGRIEWAWARHRDVSVCFMERGGLVRLRSWLLEGRPHVLHFIGHGTFDEDRAEGTVVLTDDDGMPHHRPGARPISAVGGRREWCSLGRLVSGPGR